MRTFNRHCAGVKVTLLKSESLFFYFSRRFFLYRVPTTVAFVVSLLTFLRTR